MFRTEAYNIAVSTSGQLDDLQCPTQSAMMVRVAGALGGMPHKVWWDAPVPPKAGPYSAADVDLSRWLVGKIDEIERLIPRGWGEPVERAWTALQHERRTIDRQVPQLLSALRAWAVDVEARATQANHTEAAKTMEDENKGTQEQFGEIRDAHNRALAAQAEERKVKVAYLGGEAQAAVSEKYALEKALRTAQVEPVAELLKDAISAAESMMEHTAGNALCYVRAALMGEPVASVPPPPPETLPPWISPWEGDLARCVAAKVGKALELLSQYDWARNHPSDPMKRLGAVHAWAIEMLTRADHLEHNQRVMLERGRDALIEAREYMRQALHMLLRDNVTGEQALLYDRAVDGVGAALVVFCDDLLRDGKMDVRPVERVLTRRSGAMLAHRAISAWLRKEAEAPFGRDGDRRQDIPPEALAAAYRAAWLIGECVMRDSQTTTEVARSIFGIVRERAATMIRSVR